MESIGTTATGLKLLLPPTTTPPSSSPPPTSLSILPDELTAKILVRLPVRSLLQLKRVCKSWETLISSPQFAKDHLQRSFADSTPRLAYSNIHSIAKLQCRVGFCPIQPLSKKPSAPTKVVCFQMDDALDILGSCNGYGLLCLRDPFRDSIKLWDPCTGLACPLPRIDMQKRRSFPLSAYCIILVSSSYDS